MVSGVTPRIAAWITGFIRTTGGDAARSRPSSAVRSRTGRMLQACSRAAAARVPSEARYAPAAGELNTVAGIPWPSSSAARASTGWAAPPGARRSACSTENSQLTAAAGGLLPAVVASWSRRAVK